MADLITTADVQEWAQMEGIAVPDGARIDKAVERAIREVQQYCCRAFVMSPADGDADEARVFDGQGNATLTIDDLLEIASVSLDGSEVADTGYELFGAPGPPYLYLARQVSKSLDTAAGSVTVDKTGIWTVGNANVEIVGLWGYATAVPEEVKEAACILAAVRLFGGEDGGGWTNAGIKRISVLSVSVEFAGSTEGLAAKRREALQMLRPHCRAEPEPHL